MLLTDGSHSTQKQLGFKLKRGILTVESFLSERGGLELLKETYLLETATSDVTLLKDQSAAKEFLAEKKRATERLCR